MSDVETVRTAIIQRGIFVHRYSAIEFSVSELIARAQTHPAYVQLGDMPFKFTSKISRIREIISIDGPISNFQHDLQKNLSEFLNFDEIRNFIVHGLMTISANATDRTSLQFRMYDHIEGRVHYGEFSTTLDDLQKLVKKMRPLSEEFTALVAKVVRDCRFPNPPKSHPIIRQRKKPIF